MLKRRDASNLSGKEVDIVSLREGLDLSSTFVEIRPGSAIQLVNFEPDLGGGYRRINGYERYDGHEKPSESTYYTVDVDDASVIANGDTLTGNSSGATSVVVAQDGNTLGVTDLNGSYTDGETANGTTITDTEKEKGLADPDLDAEWLLAAQDHYRDKIKAVPGDGKARYAFHYGSTRYALRATGSDLRMYKATSSGWTQVAFYDEMFFKTGTMSDALDEGVTVTGASSGATGTLKRFIKNAGNYGNDASGYMVIDTTDTFTDGENLEVNNSTVAVADGANSAISLTDGGYFEHVEHNFYGSVDTRRVYACDGVNPAWEFDGDVLTPIYYPSPTKNPSWNKPTYIMDHRTYLFIAYESGQIAHSAPGKPLVFSGLMGASEFGIGSEPTGLQPRSGDVLAIYTRNVTFGLYGTSAADFVLRLISENFGADPHTPQRVSDVYAVDEKGISPLERVQAYGDFESSTVSRAVKPILENYRGRVTSTVPVRKRNQYRVFFDDGSALVMADDKYLRNQQPVFTTISLPFTPVFVSSSDDSNGNQVIMMGDEDGFVYEDGVGYNFDGGEIEFVYRSPYMTQRSPHIKKAYRRLYLDLDNDRELTLAISTDLAYGVPEVAPGLSGDVTASSGGGFWGADDWGAFYWDSPNFSSEGVSLNGNANNISILVYANSKTIQPFTIQTLEIHYLPRRVRRE